MLRLYSCIENPPKENHLEVSAQITRLNCTIWSVSILPCSQFWLWKQIKIQNQKHFSSKATVILFYFFNILSILNCKVSSGQKTSWKQTRKANYKYACEGTRLKELHSLLAWITQSSMHPHFMFGLNASASLHCKLSSHSVILTGFKQMYDQMYYMPICLSLKWKINMCNSSVNRSWMFKLSLKMTYNYRIWFVLGKSLFPEKGNRQ